VKTVEPSPKIASWISVYQHGETGEIQVISDHRFRLHKPWNAVVEHFEYYSGRKEHPVAAYLLPSDLVVGERVFLVDLIEDRVGVFGNQGHNYRLESAYAIWNGKDFDIQWDESKDAERWVG
jgi:hypothetical protein